MVYVISTASLPALTAVTFGVTVSVAVPSTSAACVGTATRESSIVIDSSKESHLFFIIRFLPFLS